MWNSHSSSVLATSTNVRRVRADDHHHHHHGIRQQQYSTATIASSASTSSMTTTSFPRRKSNDNMRTSDSFTHRRDWCKYTHTPPIPTNSRGHVLRGQDTDSEAAAAAAVAPAHKMTQRWEPPAPPLPPFHEQRRQRAQTQSHASKSNEQEKEQSASVLTTVSGFSLGASKRRLFSSSSRSNCTSTRRFESYRHRMDCRSPSKDDTRLGGGGGSSSCSDDLPRKKRLESETAETASWATTETPRDRQQLLLSELKSKRPQPRSRHLFPSFSQLQQHPLKSTSYNDNATTSMGKQREHDRPYHHSSSTEKLKPCHQPSSCGRQRREHAHSQSAPTAALVLPCNNQTQQPPPKNQRQRGLDNERRIFTVPSAFLGNSKTKDAVHVGLIQPTKFVDMATKYVDLDTKHHKSDREEITEVACGSSSRKRSFQQIESSEEDECEEGEIILLHNKPQQEQQEQQQSPKIPKIILSNEEQQCKEAEINLHNQTQQQQQQQQSSSKMTALSNGDKEYPEGGMLLQNQQQYSSSTISRKMPNGEEEYEEGEINGHCSSKILNNLSNDEQECEEGEILLHNKPQQHSLSKIQTNKSYEEGDYQEGEINMDNKPQQHFSSKIRTNTSNQEKEYEVGEIILHNKPQQQSLSTIPTNNSTDSVAITCEETITPWNPMSSVYAARRERPSPDVPTISTLPTNGIVAVSYEGDHSSLWPSSFARRWQPASSTSDLLSRGANGEIGSIRKDKAHTRVDSFPSTNDNSLLSLNAHLPSSDSISRGASTSLKVEAHTFVESPGTSPTTSESDHSLLSSSVSISSSESLTTGALPPFKHQAHTIVDSSSTSENDHVVSSASSVESSDSLSRCAVTPSKHDTHTIVGSPGLGSSRSENDDSLVSSCSSVGSSDSLSTGALPSTHDMHTDSLGTSFSSSKNDHSLASLNSCDVKVSNDESHARLDLRARKPPPTEMKDKEVHVSSITSISMDDASKNKISSTSLLRRESDQNDETPAIVNCQPSTKDNQHGPISSTSRETRPLVICERAQDLWRVPRKVPNKNAVAQHVGNKDWQVDGEIISQQTLLSVSEKQPMEFLFTVSPSCSSTDESSGSVCLHDSTAVDANSTDSSLQNAQIADDNDDDDDVDNDNASRIESLPKISTKTLTTLMSPSMALDPQTSSSAALKPTCEADPTERVNSNDVMRSITPDSTERIKNCDNVCPLTSLTVTDVEDQRLSWCVSLQPPLAVLHLALLEGLKMRPTRNESGTRKQRSNFRPTGGCVVQWNGFVHSEKNHRGANLNSTDGLYFSSQQLEGRLEMSIRNACSAGTNALLKALPSKNKPSSAVLLQWKQFLKSWSTYPTDSPQDIQQSIECYNERRMHERDRSCKHKRRVGSVIATQVDPVHVGDAHGACLRCLFHHKQAAAMVDEDILWWRHGEGRPCLRNLTKLRRILLPITVVVSQSSTGEDEHSRCKDNGDNQQCNIQAIGLSLADLLCRVPELRTATIDILLRHAVVLYTWTREVAGSSEVLIKYVSLQNHLIDTLRRAGGRHSFLGTTLDLDHLEVTDLPLTGARTSRQNRRLYPENTRLLLLDIRAKRKQLFKEYETINSSRPFMVNESVLITYQDDEMTESEFLEEAYFMAKVHATIPRPFDPLTSRPLFSQAKLSASQMARFKRIFFNDDGSLSEICAADVSYSLKHHYINFSNRLNAGWNDKRWQIPFRQHGSTLVRTRAAVESLLSEAGIVSPSHETIDDCGLLVGGTADQSLHHDISRQWTVWKPDRFAEAAATVGWEANRLAYNLAMAGKYSPSAVLLAMGPSNKLQIGVQKDHIERVGGSGSQRCRIRHGRPYEEFKIVRENNCLVVLEAETGCVFTGDFPHAGVRNFAPGSEEDRLMMNLYDAIDSILQTDLDHTLTIQSIINVLTSFKGLNRICRFHCSTHLIETKMKVPNNMVGYTGCQANLPGGSAEDFV